MEQDVTRALRREETITLALRALYEQYGFRKYRMGKFEEYELYMENKNFLKNPNIITFHDLDGRLMALKPDVTLSIAKNTRANTRSSEKVYYLENVYWLEKQSGGYKEVSQLGLESIGKLDAFSYYEVLALAKETLSAISESHRMQVSHIGFWVALLDGAGVPPFAAELIVKAASLCGGFPETLAAARSRANIDALTGVRNKHAYVDLEAQIDREIQAGTSDPFALVIFDVNGLKHVNDTLGHQAGDKFLQDACSEICRLFKHSPVFRIGGDEFVAVARGQDYEDLDALIETLDRNNQERLTAGGIVIARGMARFNGYHSVGALFEDADRRMYENKRDLKGSTE